MVNGSSPFDAGYRLLALTLVTPIGVGVAVHLIQALKLPPLYVLLGGAVVQTIGLSLMISLSVSQQNIPSTQYGYDAILGMGLGLSLGSIILMTTIVFEPRDMGEYHPIPGQFLSLTF